MFLTELVIKNPTKGDMQGECVWCGRETQHGYVICVSSNFTGWSYFSKGNCLCPYCYSFLKNQLFRRKSWLATCDDVFFLERKQIEGILSNPPTPPWFLYVTKMGQKQGWLSCINSVNFSCSRFYIGYESVDFPIFMELMQAKKMIDIVKKLRQRKVSKAELLSGHFKMKTYERAIKGKYEELLELAKRQAGKPNWEVICHVCQ